MAPACVATARQVRIHEKAVDVFVWRAKTLGFGPAPDDPKLLEACLADVVRSRAICTDRGALVGLVLQLLSSKGQPVRCQLPDPLLGSAEVEVIDVNNKFSYVDPTHFRNALLNLRITCRPTKEDKGEQALLFELQLHHEEILKWNNQARATCALHSRRP